MSSTSTTRRSRSGCQVRTTTLRLRALARQSIERTSSPRTYSRSESNSVPWPRTRIAARPSSSRSRASRLGRCLRDSNGGSDRTVPGDVEGPLPGGQAERPAQPHGDPSGAQVAAAARLQRASAAARGRPGARASRCRLPDGAGGGLPGVAEHAAHRRRPAFVDEQRRLGVGTPAGPCPTGRRRRPRGASTGGASSTSATTSSGDHQQPQPHRARARAAARPAPAPRRSSSGTRPVIDHRSARAPAPSRARRPAPRPRRRPRARPRAAARAGAPSVAWASALTSSGVTKSRPVSQAQARADAQQRGRAARADARGSATATRGWPGRCRRCSRPPRR